MAIPVRLVDGGRDFKITDLGQLVVAPFAYDEVSVQNLDVNNVAENFFKPKVGSRFVVTGMIVSADRNVGNNGAIVDVFEATTVTGTIVKSILSVDIAKSTQLPLLGLNLLISEGAYLNGKTDDNNVSVSVMGYYAPTVAGGA